MEKIGMTTDFLIQFMTKKFLIDISDIDVAAWDREIKDWENAILYGAIKLQKPASVRK